MYYFYVGNSKILIFVASIKSRKSFDIVLHCTHFVCLFYQRERGLNKEGIYLKLTEKKIKLNLDES